MLFAKWHFVSASMCYCLLIQVRSMYTCPLKLAQECLSLKNLNIQIETMAWEVYPHHSWVISIQEGSWLGRGLLKLPSSLRLTLQGAVWPFTGKAPVINEPIYAMMFGVLSYTVMRLLWCGKFNGNIVDHISVKWGLKNWFRWPLKNPIILIKRKTDNKMIK